MQYKESAQHCFNQYLHSGDHGLSKVSLPSLFSRTLMLLRG